MYEGDCDEKSRDGDVFVKRLCRLPILATTIGQLNSFYSGAKGKNRLLKFTMETAETGVGTIISTAQPVVSRFDKQILVLNNIACAQLDRLENSYPVITKPTDEVVKETKELCVGAVQPVVRCVNSVKNYGCEKVSGIRTYTGEKIEGVRTFGVNTVSAVARVGSDQMTKVLSIPVCRGVMNKFDAALDVADRYVENHLPEEGGEGGGPVRSSEADVVLWSKAYRLSSKVHRRLYARALGRLERVQQRAKETTAKLHVVLNVVEYAQSNVNGAKERAWHIWQEINKKDEQLIEEATEKDMSYYDSTFDRQAIATARHLVKKLRSILSWVDVSSVSSVPGAVYGKLGSSVSVVQALPGAVFQKLEQLKNSTNVLSNIFSKETVSIRDLPQSMLDNARNTLHQLCDSLSDLVEWTTKNTCNSQITMGLPGYGQLFGARKWNASEFSDESESESEISHENSANTQCQDENDQENKSSRVEQEQEQRTDGSSWDHAEHEDCQQHKHHEDCEKHEDRERLEDSEQHKDHEQHEDREQHEDHAQIAATDNAGDQKPPVKAAEEPEDGASKPSNLNEEEDDSETDEDAADDLKDKEDEELD